MVPKSIKSISVLLLLFLLFTSTASAHLIEGTITDPDGNPLEGATVSSLAGDAVTNATGYYNINASETQSYKITAYMGDYEPNSTKITAPASNVDLILSPFAKLTAMPYEIYGVLILITILTGAYGYLYIDNRNYTDVLAVLFSCIASAVVAYTSFSGIGYNYNTESVISQAVYQSAALGLFWSAVAVITAMYFILKLHDIFIDNTEEWTL